MHTERRRSAGESVMVTKTDRWVLGCWAVNLGLFLHVVLFETPLWLTYLYNGLLYGIIAVIGYYSHRIRNIVVLGTVAGFVELGADHFLVAVAGTLVYPESLPMLGSSPLYMPLAWAIVITHLGYVGIRVNEIYGREAAMVGPSIAAMALIGVYEYGAFYAGIWEYVRAPLVTLGHVPLFIVVAEGLIFATLHEFVQLERPLTAGVGFGLLITIIYTTTYGLFSAIAA